MDFFEIEGFVALAGHLHFARAAAAVHVSPSALSRMIGRLEEELGVRLFIRDTRTVELTEQGRVFLDFARETLARRDALHLMFNSTDGTLKGTLRIYASVTACYSFLPPLVARLRTMHPGLRIMVETGDAAESLRVVREGQADCAVASLPEGGALDLHTYMIQNSPLVFVGSDLCMARPQAGSFSPRDLAQTPLILPQRGIVRERIDRWFREQSVRPHISAEVSGNEAVLALVNLGLGIGVVPQIVLDNSPFAHGLWVVPVGVNLGDHAIGLVMRKDGMVHRAMEGLLTTVYPRGTWIDTRPSR